MAGGTIVRPFLEEPPLPKPTLLVADADARSLRILELSLRRAGFEVSTAAGGGQALDRITASPPDLLICAAEDGIALCRALRRRSGLESLPVLLISADKTLAGKAMEAGADDFLRKPILLRELLRRVQLLLEGRELSQEGGAAAVTGSVRDFGLVDALQALLATRRSAVVTCEACGRTGHVWVREGEVVDAELGALGGAAAFARLLTWESGSFRVDPGPVDRHSSIEGGTDAALVEAMRQVDELAKVSRELSMTTVFELDGEQLAAHLDELPDEVNGVVRNFDGGRTLREAIDLSPVDDLSTIEVVRRLVGEGILRALEAKKTALGEKKPSLQDWLSSAPPPEQGEAPRLSLDAARSAAALVQEPAQVELQMAEAQVEPAVVERAPVTPIPIVRYPPLRGARRERLRGEAEEARARIAGGQVLRLSRVVELPPYRNDGSDAFGGARRMSPAVGEAARKFAPDAPVARLLFGPLEEEATQLSSRLVNGSAAAEAGAPPIAAPSPAEAEEIPDLVEALELADAVPEATAAADVETEPPGPASPEPGMAAPVPTPPIAPVAADTPAPPSSTASPDRAVDAVVQPRRRVRSWVAAAAAAGLAAIWFLRPQPLTERKDASWLHAVASSPVAPSADRAAAPVGPSKPIEPVAAAPPAAAAQQPMSVAAAAPASFAQSPASDALYSKALEQGENQLRLGKYRLAISHFRRAVREKPRAVPALLALGDAYLEADEPRSAVAPLESAARLDGKSGRAQLLLGTAYQSLGRNAQAKQAYQRYLDLEPRGEFVRDVRLILANLGH